MGERIGFPRERALGTFATFVVAWWYGPEYPCGGWWGVRWTVCPHQFVSQVGGSLIHNSGRGCQLPKIRVSRNNMPMLVYYSGHFLGDW